MNDTHAAGEGAVDAGNGVMAAENQFFEALMLSDRERLDRVLGSDFILVDVMTGSEVPRAVFVDLIGSGRLVFDSVARLEARLRLYGGTAIVTGATRMSGRYEGERFSVHSRYTHVYVSGEGGWRLVTAQGTPVAPAAG